MSHRSHSGYWLAASAVAVLLVGPHRAVADQDAGAATVDGGVAPGTAPLADAGAAGDAAIGVFLPGLDQPGVVPPVARASVAAGDVQLGRAFSVFITVTHDDGITVNLPASLDFGSAFDEPSEARRSTEDRRRPDGTLVREFEIELVAWAVGDLQLPPIQVTYVVQGTAYVVQTEPVPIRVISYIGEGDGDLRDIAPPVSVSKTNWTLLSALLGAAAALLLFFAVVVVVRAWRRRRKRGRPGRRPEVAAVALSIDAAALARIDALEQSGALDAEDLEPAYVELSEIVRTYLGRRYGFPALDSTTAEIEARLAEGPASGAGALLRDCDLIKYANYAADRDDACQALADARRLVAATREVAPEATRVGTGVETGAGVASGPAAEAVVGPAAEAVVGPAAEAVVGPAAEAVVGPAAETGVGVGTGVGTGVGVGPGVGTGGPAPGKEGADA